MKGRKEYNFGIGVRLREVRKNLGVSQEHFAETMNMSVNHYRKLETGAYSLTVERIIQLNQVYCVDPTYLLLGIRNDNELLSLIANCTTYESRERLCRVLELGIEIIREGYREKEYYHT